MSLQGQAVRDKNLNSSDASEGFKFNHISTETLLSWFFGTQSSVKLQSNNVGIKLNKDWTEKSQYQQQCSTILQILGMFVEAPQQDTEKLNRFWSRLNMIQRKNFQRQFGKVWLVYSKEVINKAMKVK